MALHTNPLIDKQIVLTPSAIKRIIEVLKIKQPKMFLRLKVASGGCYGFSYIFEFDSNLETNDMIITNLDENESVIFAISPKFLKYINEATLDYIDELGASYFTVLNNQNASGGCGCGNSFSVKDE